MAGKDYNPELEFNCVDCIQSDAYQNMVQCDQCASWRHYACAGVDDSVEDHDFICRTCSAGKDDRTRSLDPGSDTMTMADSMTRLIKEQELEIKKLELEVKERFLKQREELLEVAVARNSRNRKSSVSIQGNQQRISNWISSTENPNEDGEDEDVQPYPRPVSQDAYLYDVGSKQRLVDRLNQFELNGSPTADDVQDLLNLCKETLVLTDKANRIGTIPKCRTTWKSVDEATDPTLRLPSVQKDRFLHSNNLEAVPRPSQWNTESRRWLIDQPIQPTSRVEFVGPGPVYPSALPNHPKESGSSNGVKQPSVPVEECRKLKTTWDLIQHELDVFWKRWLKEYMPIIRRRSKWFKQVRPIEVGDLVLMVDSKVRNGWIRGRIEDVIAGSDDQVRQVSVRTANGVLRRAVHQLALLDVGRVSAVSVDTQMHPGEDVGKQATLP
ncbi:uncharacterized protein LOC129750714 [Uranotaenia lowii]|uniref:uncharacterized protein LOC129742098 n=1 Tax=Uranotaenia lowii TaxID=190385 RepID=UPI00247AC00A|nr:uncharacterized protein LOC129742098 [Uranotaenia lowii]XP_055601698.1 uncharacterized protein LOC129750714 [Uranotaenia lowii]